MMAQTPESMAERGFGECLAVVWPRSAEDAGQRVWNRRGAITYALAAALLVGQGRLSASPAPSLAPVMLVTST